MSGLLVFLTPLWILSSLIVSSLLTCSIFSSFVNSLPHMFPFFRTCSFSASCSISSSWVPSLPHLFPLSATCSLCFSPVPSLPHLSPFFHKCSLSSPTVPPPHLFPLSLFTLTNSNSLTISALTRWFLSVLRRSSLVWCSCSWSCCGWPDLLDSCPAGLPSFLSEPPALFPHLSHTKVKIVPDKGCDVSLNSYSGYITDATVALLLGLLFFIVPAYGPQKKYGTATDQIMSGVSFDLKTSAAWKYLVIISVHVNSSTGGRWTDLKMM